MVIHVFRNIIHLPAIATYMCY